MAFSGMNPDQMSRWHYTPSDSPQFSDEGYSTGSLEQEPETDSNLFACAPRCHVTSNGLNGLVKNSHAVYAVNAVNGQRSPNVKEHVVYDTHETSQQLYYSNPVESKKPPVSGPGRKCDQGSKSRPARPPLLPPCRVCGDRASGFHYGVNTCEACKGFFRRSINKTSDPYACVGSGHCKLVPGKRTACSACRYQRCLEVGMSKSAIKTGRYTHELRSKNIMEVKKLQMNQGPEEKSPSVDKVTDMVMDTLNDSSLDRAPSPPCRVVDKDMEELLTTFMEGQSKLHECLDDYYNEELMRSKQVAVYDRYMKNKRESLARARAAMPECCCKRDNSVQINIIKDIPPEVVFKREHSSANPGDVGEVITKQDITSRGEVTRTGLSNTNETLCSGVTLGQVTRNGDSVNTRDINGMSVKREDIPKLNGHSTVQSLKQRILNCKENNQNLSNNAPEHTSQTSKTCATCNASGVKEVSKGDHSDEEKKAEVLTLVMLDMERGVQGILAFCRCLPGFDGLPSTDQATLVKAARFDIWYIGHIRCFNVDLRVGACEWQFHAEELEKVWGKRIVELAFRLSRRGQELDLSKEETAALRALVLTFPDRCYPLTSRAAVESLHARMLQLLRYVCARRNRKFNSWFPKVIDFLTILREFGISFEQVSSCLKLDWSVLHDNPYLLEVFLS